MAELVLGAMVAGALARNDRYNRTTLERLFEAPLDLLTMGEMSRTREEVWRRERQQRRGPIYVGGTFSGGHDESNGQEPNSQEEPSDPAPIEPMPIEPPSQQLREQLENQTQISLAALEQLRIRQSEEAEAAQREEQRRRHEEQRDAMVTQQLHNVMDRMAETCKRRPWRR
jgi:hypothetical protein